MVLKFLRYIIFFVAASTLLVSSYALSISGYEDPAPKILYQVDESHPPFEFSSGNEVYGFGIDLAKIIFGTGNYDVQYYSDTWSNVYERIVKREIDICGLLVVTNDRKKDILFTKPVVKTHRAVYAKTSLAINDISDIANYRVGVQKSDHSETILQNDLGIKNYFTFKDLEECILALKEGRIDIVFGNQEVTNYLLVKHQLSNEISPHILNLYPLDLAFGISKSRPELVSFMNNQIKKLQKSGLYEQIFLKYFYRQSEYYRTQQQKNLILVGLIILIIIGGTVMLFNGFIKHLRKIVERATDNLKKEQELLRITLLSITDGVMAVNAQGKITFMNHVAERLTGFSEGESIDRPLNEVLNIIDTNSGIRYEVPIKEVLDFGYPINFNSLNILLSKENSQHLILGSVSPIKNDLDEVSGVLVAFQDISEKKQAEETIKYHEYYDSLTDLPNRKLFNQYLNSALENTYRNNKKVSILIIGLDYFKDINNSLGHHIGDKLLKLASERLAKVLNENNVLARMGGDEFAILMHQTGEAKKACELAHKILEELRFPFSIDDHELYITASIGIAVYPDDGSDSSIIMKHASTALYNAKKNGRNTYESCTLADDKEVMERFSLTKDLHTALERNEMILHYQPKTDSITGTVIGMEALIRWDHPEKGLISPAIFIPLAEEIGLIKQLDTWVLRTACSQFNSLKEIYKQPIRLSVNLSAYQFRNHNLVDTIEQVLKETSFAPAELELEITETTVMENIDFTIKTLKKLNKMGVNISMDDFGSGYSSLNYLRRFPIDILKIDRSFISDIAKDENTKVIVKSIIDVAHSLKLKVTAEGVETEDQLSILKQMHCDEIQGFLISKPLPLMEMQNNLLFYMV